MVDLATYKIVFEEIDGQSTYRVSEMGQDFARLFDGAKAFQFIPKERDFEYYFRKARGSWRIVELRGLIREEDKKRNPMLPHTWELGD